MAKKEILKKVNDSIRDSNLEGLVIKDTYLNINIIHLSISKIKSLIKDNNYYFRLDNKIRYQLFNPSQKYYK